jgi:hypothetical protein
MGSARTSPIEQDLTGVVTTLKATSAVTALVSTRIYNNVPQDTTYPYIEVTSPTDRAEDTCGRFGALALVDVKAVSQSFGDREAARILNACITALNFVAPALTGHATLGLTWESNDRFREVINGVVTRHHVATFRMWTEQSS